MEPGSVERRLDQRRPRQRRSARRDLAESVDADGDRANDDDCESKFAGHYLLSNRGFGQRAHVIASVASLSIASSYRLLFGRQRFPAGNGASTRPRLHIVSDAREQPAQLDRGRQFTTLNEGSTDRVGLCFGDDKHPERMSA